MASESARAMRYNLRSANRERRQQDRGIYRELARQSMIEDSRPRQNSSDIVLEDVTDDLDTNQSKIASSSNTILKQTRFPPSIEGQLEQGSLDLKTPS